MKFQQDPVFGVGINLFGCHFFTILQKVEKVSGFQFSDEEILTIYKYCVDRLFIDKEKFDSNGKLEDACYIRSGKDVFNVASELIGCSIRCIDYRHEKSDYIKTEKEEIIYKCERSSYPGYHFISSNGGTKKPWQLNVEFDPIQKHTPNKVKPWAWVNGSWTQDDGWVDGVRVLVLK